MMVQDPRLSLICAELFPGIAQKMGIPQDQLNNCLTELSLGKSHSIIGNVKSDDNGKTFNITIPFGLLIFHLKMAYIFLARMNVINDSGEVVRKTQINTEKIIKVAKKTVDDFWKANESNEDSMLSEEIEYHQLNDRQQELLGFVVHYADTFVVAHEFAHAIIWSVPHLITKEKLIADAAIHSSGQPPPLEINDLESWKNELTADCIAMQLCLDICENQIQKMVMHASAIMSLYSYYMLESGYEQIKGHPLEYATHPPSSLRIKFIQSFSDWPGSNDLGSLFQQLGNFILSGFRF